MFKPQYKQLINVDGIKLKPSDVRKSHSIATASSSVFSAVTSCFPKLLKCHTDMVASYHVVPYLRCYASLVTSEYWKCNINVVTRTCSGFYWYIRTLRDCVYISVKPLAAVLQPINVCKYACMHVCMYICMYICFYTYIL